MVKKFASILLISLACMIQLAHSVVPHSHADHHHHGKKHHHESNTDGQGIFHFFSHSQHSTEIFTSQTEDITINCADDFQTATAQDYSTAQRFCAKPLATIGYVERYIYISPHLVSLQFRGPPTA